MNAKHGLFHVEQPEGDLPPLQIEVRERRFRRAV